jgi:hypothetical protein
MAEAKIRVAISSAPGMQFLRGGILFSVSARLDSVLDLPDDLAFAAVSYPKLGRREHVRILPRGSPGMSLSGD